jgi:hypothetical protein
VTTSRADWRVGHACHEGNNNLGFVQCQRRVGVAVRPQRHRSEHFACEREGARLQTNEFEVSWGVA